MNRTAASLLFAAAAMASGCSAARTAQPVAPPGLAARVESAPTPLEEYRQTLAALKQQQRETQALAEELDRARDEIASLYNRLAAEQALRREAQAQLEAAKSGKLQADAQTMATLKAELERTRAELAAARAELKDRREELMKLILEQQEWNKFVLSRIKPQPQQ